MDPSNINRCQEILWKQLNERSVIRHLIPQADRIKRQVEFSARGRKSAVTLVIGPTDSGKKNLIEKVIIDHFEENIRNQSTTSFARVNGKFHLTDDKVYIKAIAFAIRAHHVVL